MQRDQEAHDKNLKIGYEYKFIFLTKTKAQQLLKDGSVTLQQKTKSRKNEKFKMTITRSICLGIFNITCFQNWRSHYASSIVTRTEI